MKSIDPKIVNEINKLADKGVTDGIIAKKLKLSLHVVGKYTREYWELKMKNKKP